ncbi:hypothetical protein Tco_0216614 [Tanacetum coccineum]
MNEDYYHEHKSLAIDSNSFGFDNFKPAIFRQSFQTSSTNEPQEALQAQEDLIKSIESFLKKFNRISFGKTPKVLLHAWDNFIEVKHAQPEGSNDVEYVEASPPNSEPVSSKVMEIVIPEVGRIEDDILLIKDDTLREKLLNVNRLVAKIEALKDNPVPSSVVVTKSTQHFLTFSGGD